ncbi:MAG: hypothetical protein ACREF8_05050, partial [Chthoniobacterales bacterium]
SIRSSTRPRNTVARLPNEYDFAMRKLWLSLGTLAFLALAAALAVAWLNPRLTKYVEGDAFRVALEKETAKGLHFPQGHFAPIRRIGFLSAATAGFHATRGEKAMTKIEAHDVTARFNPLGIFLRRWQLDELHIASGEVGIQTYEPKPEPSPSKPWYHVFLPDRVYLKRVWSDPADITWQLAGKPGGFYGGHLQITPHGRDFEYDLKKATLRSIHLPELPLRHTHLVITKTLLTVETLDLAGGSDGQGLIHAEGTRGTRDDKSVDFKINFEQLPIREWLPTSWHEHVAGAAAGEMHWRGPDPKMHSASVQGALRIAGGRVEGLDFLKKLAALTKKKSLESLQLTECSAEIDWKNGSGEIKKIAIEDEGKFRIEGNISLRNKSLGGIIQLGVVPEYLKWLLHAEEVFHHADGGYLWTTVHLSGTPDQPGQDLSPRILDALKESPSDFLGVIFREVGEWLEQTLDGE